MTNKYRALKAWCAAHVVLVALIVSGVSAGTALAVWAIIQSGASGTSSGTVATAPTLKAITFATDSTQTPVAVVPCTSGTGSSCTGGTAGTIPWQLTDNASVNENLQTINVALTTSDDTTDNCKSHLFLTGGTPGTGSYGPGPGVTGQKLTYVADPSTPTGCSGATVTATFSGTTNP